MNNISVSEWLAISALALSLINIVVSIFLVKKYGDVAGAKEIIKYEEDKATKARIIGLQALLNEVQRIRKLAEYNSALKYDRVKGPQQDVVNVLKMPVSAFETALLSRESSLLVAGEHDPDSEPFSSIAAYLTEAQAINQHVDTYYRLLRGLGAIAGTGGYGAGARDKALGQIKESSQALPEILDRLEKHLIRELADRA